MQRSTRDESRQGGSPNTPPKCQAKARRFLLNLLALGPVPTNEIKKAAHAHGCAWASVRRAQRVVGAEAVRHGEEGRRGGGSWWWVLTVPGVEHLKDSPNEHLNVLSNEPEFSGASRSTAGASLLSLNTLTDDSEVGPDEEEL